MAGLLLLQLHLLCFLIKLIKKTHVIESVSEAVKVSSGRGRVHKFKRIEVVYVVMIGDRGKVGIIPSGHQCCELFISDAMFRTWRNWCVDLFALSWRAVVGNVLARSSHFWQQLLRFLH